MAVLLIGSLTPFVRHLASFGSLTFLSPNVWGLFLMNLFPNFAFVGGFFLKKGLVRESASSSHLTSSGSNCLPSGILSLLRMCSVSFSDNTFNSFLSSMISLMLMLFLLSASDTSLVMPWTWWISASYFEISSENLRSIPAESLHILR